ncbi:hypothetical protein SS50377_22115 [Spironucleus salmonicida]|uniref:Uncharacterized protein n=1 Tax=Spironucleus salmonicida TaxID=348837 RepID=V6LM54_9EUKA|nr:hypothetical protein SS50377_22115 [Spironucleus salmonicida]|eukprot:EST45725.1 Hypothetical protein SS50377_14297 [Spironucleus salmonicida]
MAKELLDDYDFNPDFKDIKNNLIQAYYANDDQELANLFNQLGKSFETYDHFKDASLCHYFDAQICKQIQNNKGLAVALANISICLSMLYEDYPDHNEQADNKDFIASYDFGFLIYFEQSVNLVYNNEELFELVFRKFVIAGYNCFRVMQIFDINIINPIISFIQKYMTLSLNYRSKEIYWEVILSILHIYIKVGLINQAKLLVLFLQDNISSFNQNFELYKSFLIYYFELSFISDTPLDENILQLCENMLKTFQSSQQVSKYCNELADLFIQCGQVKYFGWINNLFKFFATSEMKNYYQQKFNQVKLELELLQKQNLNDMYIQAIIKYSLFNHNSLITSNSLLQNIYEFLLLQNKGDFMINSKKISYQSILKNLYLFDEKEIMVSPIQILNIMIREIYIFYKFEIVYSLQNSVIVLYQFIQSSIQQDSKFIASLDFEDFIEQILLSYFRNKIQNNQTESSEFQELWQLRIQHKHQYCVDYLLDYIGFCYSEDSYIQNLNEKISVDQIMINQKLVNKKRQSKIIALLTNPTKQIAPIHKKKIVKKVYTSQSSLNPIKTKNIDMFILKTQLESTSYTQSLTEDEVQPTPKPKLLSKSTILPQNESNFQFQDLTFQDLLEPTQSPIANNVNDVLDFVKYQQFLIDYNYTQLDMKQRMEKYQEYLLFQKTFKDDNQMLLVQNQSLQQTNLTGDLEVTGPTKLSSTMIETIHNKHNEDKQLFCFDTNKFSVIQLQNSSFIAKSLSSMYSYSLVKVNLENIVFTTDILASLLQLKNIQYLMIRNIETSNDDVQNTINDQLIQISQIPTLKSIQLSKIDYITFSTALQIILSCPADTFVFENLLGLNIFPSKQQIQPISRTIKSIKFYFCNFLSIQPPDVIACYLDIQELCFYDCLNQCLFSEILQQFIELNIDQIK